MFLRPHIHASARDGGRRVAEFPEGKAVQDIELFARLDDVEFARGRDAEEPSIHPHRRAEKVSADAFLKTDFTRRRVEAREDAAVAPEPCEFAQRDTRGHVRRGFFHLIGEFRLS